MQTKWRQKMSHFTLYINAKIDICVIDFPKQLVTYFFPQISVQGSTERLLCKVNSTSMIKHCTFPQDSDSIMHTEYMLQLPPKVCCSYIIGQRRPPMKVMLLLAAQPHPLHTQLCAEASRLLWEMIAIFTSKQDVCAGVLSLLKLI